VIKIVLADSHPIVHKGVKAVFKNSTEISVVGKALKADDLFKIIEKKIIDIIVLELDLYESEGLTVLRRIKEEYPGTRVLIYSNQPEEVYAISSLKAGASGYLNKKITLDAVVSHKLELAAFYVCSLYDVSNKL
jgi:two-component system invasion response regulator UvrY